MGLRPGESEAERYFREFILPMCRNVGDTGDLILILQDEIGDWECVLGIDPDAAAKLAALRMVLALIEARTRNSVKALQRAIDEADTFTGVAVQTLRFSEGSK